MADPVQPLSRLRALPRNVRAASLASFLADVSSEMVLNLLPLFLANVLGVRTVVIGLIEGVAEATASLVNVQSGWLSDRLRRRKRLAVAGYAVSALAKPFFALATSWGGVAAARWGDRVGKGIRTAPRDALIAGSVPAGQRGLAFGLHRAADTEGAVVGLGIAIAVVAFSQRNAGSLDAGTFQVLVLVSLAPAFLAVLALARGAEEVPVAEPPERLRLGWRGLGRPFQPPSTTGSSETLGDVDYALRARLPRRRRKSNPTARRKHRTGWAHTVRDGMPNRP
jgi:hypothetical protein